MTTKKTATTKKTRSKKAAKPRTLKVVGKTSDESAVDTAMADSPETKATTKSKAAPKEKGLSAISAAAKVLTEVNEAMNAKQLIDAIVARGYWTSPAGKTPHATLYSAILREIKAKGSDARFAKADRGKFAART
jgi:molybdopterin-guanine dinucleotide biosynthesis protein